jgi:hypothetical protein
MEAMPHGQTHSASKPLDMVKPSAVERFTHAETVLGRIIIQLQAWIGISGWHLRAFDRLRCIYEHTISAVIMKKEKKSHNNTKENRRKEERSFKDEEDVSS